MPSLFCPCAHARWQGRWEKVNDKESERTGVSEEPPQWVNLLMKRIASFLRDSQRVILVVAYSIYRKRAEAVEGIALVSWEFSGPSASLRQRSLPLFCEAAGGYAGRGEGAASRPPVTLWIRADTQRRNAFRTPLIRPQNTMSREERREVRGGGWGVQHQQGAIGGYTAHTRSAIPYNLVTSRIDKKQHPTLGVKSGVQPSSTENPFPRPEAFSF